MEKVCETNMNKYGLLLGTLRYKADGLFDSVKPDCIFLTLSSPTAPTACHSANILADKTLRECMQHTPFARMLQLGAMSTCGKRSQLSPSKDLDLRTTHRFLPHAWRSLGRQGHDEPDGAVEQRRERAAGQGWVHHTHRPGDLLGCCQRLRGAHCVSGAAFNPSTINALALLASARFPPNCSRVTLRVTKGFSGHN